MKKYDFVVGGYVVANQFLRMNCLPQVGVTAWVTNDDYDKVFFGGPGLNIAYDLGKLGCRVLPVLSYVSDDKRADIEALLAGVGESGEALEPPIPGSSGVALMMQDESKNQLTIACRNSAGMQTPPLREMDDRWFRESRYAVLAIMLPQNVPEFLKRVKKNGVPLVFSMRADKKIFPKEILWDALTTAKLIFMNDTEQDYLTELFGLEKSEALFEAGNAEVIATTCGKKGCVIRWRENGAVREQIVPITDCGACVDATGAGDAFVAGFLYGYIHDKPLEVCAQYGSTAASFVIEQTGSLENAPTREQMLQRNACRPDAPKEETP